MSRCPEIWHSCRSLLKTPSLALQYWMLSPSVAFGTACVLSCFLMAESAPQARCQEFCKKAFDHCKGEDAAYDDITDCLTSCGRSLVPEIGNIVGEDSFTCREFWIDRVVSQKAATGWIPPGLCDYAAEGGGMCDPSVPHTCESCESVPAAADRPVLNIGCSPDCQQLGRDGDCGKGPWNPKSFGACEAACKLFRRAPIDSMRGDSLECRILYENIGEQSVLPNAKKLFCPNAAVQSKMCRAGAAEQTKCEDYCDWNLKFCSFSVTETRGQCLAYCHSLDDTQLSCHLKYVAVAARSTVPQVPCMTRQACAAAPSERLAVFASAPYVPLPERRRGIDQNDEGSSDEEGSDEEDDEM